MSIYGNRITKAREKAGLTQAALAFECGWTTSRLSNYESGYRTPKAADLETVADVLDNHIGQDSIIYLITGTSALEFAAKYSDLKLNVFSAESAIEVFKAVLSESEELGFIKLRPGFKLSDLVLSFSKSCGQLVKGAVQASQKAQR